MTELQQVLMNHYEPFVLLPDEIVSNILILIDPDTLFVWRLVCKRWQRLIDTYVFQEKAARENKFANNGRGYYSFSHIHPNDVKSLDFPWYVFYTICKHDPFNRNLVKTSCGQDVNERVHWNIPKSANFKNDFNFLPSASMWLSHLLPPCLPDEIDDDMAANDPNYNDVDKIYSIRYPNLYEINQKIVFKDNGLTQNIMKSLLPEISFSTWVKNECYRHYKYKLRAIIHDQLDKTIAEHNACPLEVQHQWIKTSSSFKIRGNESSLTLNHNVNEDDTYNNTCDYKYDAYNLKILCPVVKVLLPTKFKLKLPEPKM